MSSEHLRKLFGEMANEAEPVCTVEEAEAVLAHYPLRDCTGKFGQVVVVWIDPLAIYRVSASSYNEARAAFTAFTIDYLRYMTPGKLPPKGDPDVARDERLLLHRRDWLIGRRPDPPPDGL